MNEELSNEYLLEMIETHEASIITITDLLERTSKGLFELTVIVNKMLKEKIDGETNRID